MKLAFRLQMYICMCTYDHMCTCVFAYIISKIVLFFFLMMGISKSYCGIEQLHLKWQLY